MKKTCFYTKSALRWFRIIALSCAILLLISEIMSLFSGALRELIRGNSVDYHIIFGRIFNFISIIFFVLMIIFPQKFGFTAIIAFMYSISIIIFEPENFMGIIMFFFGTAILFARGLLKKHTKQKLITLFIFLFCLLLSHLRFGLNIFLGYLIQNVGVILVLCLSIFFLRSYYLDTLVFEDKRLNIASFTGLTERDFRILQKIQNGFKYFMIEEKEGYSEGGLKNRLHKVFKIMEVGDKQGFLSCYSDWELYYNPETAEIDFAKINEHYSKKI